MAKEPKNHEPKPDSVVHHEERHAKMQKESADVSVTQAEDAEIARSGVSPHIGESRDALLQRIRDMRDAADKPAEPVAAPFMSEAMKKQLEAEQEAGRKVVAAAEAAKKTNQEIAEKAAAEAAGGKK